MNCPHLKESPYPSSCKLLSCKANKETYIPSITELDEYCRQRRHRLCPFYGHTGDRDRRRIRLHG
jgi:hypothetical protein